MVFFFNEQQPYIDRVSDEILAAKLKAYKKRRLGHLDWVFLNGVRGLGRREPICADLGHLELITRLGLLRETGYALLRPALATSKWRPRADAAR